MSGRRARAPGKLLISGAYVVLEGAPAIVAAVDRYVIADADRPADFEAEEVKAAIAAGVIDHAPWFDASALRTAAPDGSSRKLGVGSSAAILAASIATHFAPRGLAEDALQAAVFPPALAAHRAAQPRGSGVDVAASVFGGVILAERASDGSLRVAPHALPEGTVIEVFACPVSASTAVLLGHVQALRDADPARYRSIMNAAADSARAAIRATSANALIQAVRAQFTALADLGEAAGATIVTPAMAELAPLAEAQGAAFGPSGAGGGDIAIWLGDRPSSDAFRRAARERSFEHLAITVGARGVHLLDG